MTLRHPARTHHAAARRWLSAARESLRRAAASGEGNAYWIACAVEDLLRADEHRALARKWRLDPRLDARVLRPLAKARVSDASTTELDGDDDALSHGPQKLVEGYFAAARQALRLARLYASEPGSSGRRERECVEQARAYRDRIRELRRATSAPLAAGPGISKARDVDEPASDSRRTG